jgi:hypothetical protein
LTPNNAWWMFADEINYVDADRMLWNLCNLHLIILPSLMHDDDCFIIC